VGALGVGVGVGRGRMLEPEEIVQHVGRALGAEDPFRGRTVLVTAGPTREPVDAVRYVGNRSSGKMGYALAAAAWRRGAHVQLISGPSALVDPVGVEVHRVETARDMRDRVVDALPAADLAVFAAAVADYRPAEARDEKVKRGELGDAWSLDLTTNPDVAADTKGLRKKGSVVVGFALETRELLENARKKLEEKGFDLVVANLAAAGSGFEADDNEVTLLDASGQTQALPRLSKDEVAEEILDRAASLMARLS